MKINHISRRTRSAFTLIEMIGVLAVIAILAAVLIPKVFEAINSSRISNASMTINTVKTAIADHYAKAGSLDAQVDQNGQFVAAVPATTDYDKVPLLTEGFLDKPFAVKIGNGDDTLNNIQMFDATGLTNNVAVTAAATTGFNLDGDGGALNDVMGTWCIQSVIDGVTASDAWELSRRIDGPDMSAAAPGGADLVGRVKYAAPAAGVTTVYVYLTHR